jgi:hypothetical protein
LRLCGQGSAQPQAHVHPVVRAKCGASIFSKERHYVCTVRYMILYGSNLANESLYSPVRVLRIGAYSLAPLAVLAGPEPRQLNSKFDVSAIK